MTHEFGAGNGDGLRVGDVSCVVKKCKKNTTGRPGELVAERVISTLGCRKTTTE
jgi:hypothetical protein